MSATPLISLQEATKGFSDRPLFSVLSLVISEGERLALIGNNGCGKSTLLKILAGLEELDSGAVSSRKGIRCAYVSQQDIFPADRTVSEVIDQHLAAHGFEHDEIARRSSVYLGLAEFDDFEASVSSLSGGWKKRLSLARALALEPDCLLLDEPTNHLDIDSIEWLEEQLQKLDCAIIFVSHDRYFIEQLATRVIEISSEYPRDHLESVGAYADYIEYRETVTEQLQQQKRSLANKVRREVEWLRQGVKARTTKSKSRIQEAHKLIDTLQSSPRLERQRVELEFSSTQRKTKELLKAERISQSINGKTLFQDVSLVLSPGTRLAVVGPNGSGKTTFVRTLLGQLPPQRGKIIQAQGVQITFLDQARSELSDKATLKEFLAPHSDSIMFQGQPIHVAAWAARFLFSHHQLGLTLGSLSGGERARALLAKSISQNADILVFDEPTNDLDIATLENLEEGFDSFPGAVVLISHDRYILDRVASIVLGLHDGAAKIFGDYRQWDEYRRTLPDLSSKTSAESKAKSSVQGTASRKKLSYKDVRELSTIEGDIAKAEAALGETQQMIESGRYASDAAKLTELCSLVTKQQEEVERLYLRWQELETLKQSLEM
jgi:ATP-binding cassette subfamily F protein uup